MKEKKEGKIIWSFSMFFFLKQETFSFHSEFVCIVDVFALEYSVSPRWRSRGKKGSKKGW